MSPIAFPFIWDPFPFQHYNSYNGSPDDISDCVCPN